MALEQPELSPRELATRFINDAIRAELQARGELARGNVSGDRSEGGALTFQNRPVFNQRCTAYKSPRL